MKEAAEPYFTFWFTQSAVMEPTIQVASNPTNFKCLSQVLQNKGKTALCACELWNWRGAGRGC